MLVQTYLPGQNRLKVVHLRIRSSVESYKKIVCILLRKMRSCALIVHYCPHCTDVIFATCDEYKPGLT